MFEEADLILSYSRAEAIRDGVLIDVSDCVEASGLPHSGCTHCRFLRGRYRWRKRRGGKTRASRDCADFTARQHRRKVETASISSSKRLLLPC